MPGLGLYQSAVFSSSLLDDFVAVSRRFGDQRQRHKTQIALHQHAPRPHPVFSVSSAAETAAHAMPPAKTKAAEAAAAVPAGTPFSSVRFAMSVHFWFSFCTKIYL